MLGGPAGRQGSVLGLRRKDGAWHRWVPWMDGQKDREWQFLGKSTLARGSSEAVATQRVFTPEGARESPAVCHRGASSFGAFDLGRLKVRVQTGRPAAWAHTSRDPLSGNLTPLCPRFSGAQACPGTSHWHHVLTSCSRDLSANGQNDPGRPGDGPGGPAEVSGEAEGATEVGG